MSNFWSSFFWEQVFPRLDLALAASERNPKDKGAYYLIDCPQCNKREAFLYKNKGLAKCNRDNSCGFRGDALNVCAGTTSIDSETFVSTIRRLAGIANVEIPENQRTPEEKIEYARLKAYANLHEEICEKTKSLLIKSPDAVAYLNHRGFQPTQFYFGFIPDLKALELTNEQLIEAGFKSPENENQDSTYWFQRIIIPIRDKRSKPIGFVGRRILLPDNRGAGIGDNAPNTLYTRGVSFSQIGAIGLDLCKTERAVLVEGGVFGALQVRSCGVDSIAIGGNLGAMNSERWDALSGSNIREVTIASDNDMAGQKFFLAALDAARDAKNPPAIYVLDSRAYGDSKAPDDYILKHGRQAFRELLRERVPAITYRAYLYSLGLDLSDKADVAIYADRALKFADSLHSATDRLTLDADYFEVVSKESGIKFDSLRTAANERIMAAEQSRLAEQIAEAAREQDFESIRKALAENDASNLGKISFRPVRTASEEIEDVERILSAYAGKRHIGITQSKLPRLDDALSGYRGVTLVASRTSVGKTMFVIQQVLDILATNPDTCAVFCSIEMSFDRIISRAWAHLGGINWEDMVLGSRRHLGTDLPFTESDLAKRSMGIRAFKQLAKRLVILDKTNTKNFTTDGIVFRTEQLQAETDCSRSINVIDYVDVYDVPREIRSEHRTEIEQAKWQMEQMIELRDRRNGDPVIAITEVRKGGGGSEANTSKLTVDDVMGTSRKVYASDAVLVYNPLTNVEYAENFSEGTGVCLPAVKEYEPIDPTPKEKRKVNEYGERVRDQFRKLGMDFATINVPKVRDAGNRDTIKMTNFFRQSRFLEGFVDHAELERRDKELAGQNHHWQDDGEEDTVDF